MTLISGILRKALWLFLLFVFLVVGAALMANLPAQFRDMRHDADLLRQSSQALNENQVKFREATNRLLSEATAEEVLIRRSSAAELDKIEANLKDRHHDATLRIKHDRFGWVTDPHAMLQSELSEKVELPLIDRAIVLVQFRKKSLGAIASEQQQRFKLRNKISAYNSKVAQFNADEIAWKRLRASAEAQWRNPICQRVSVPGLCTLANSARAERIVLDRRRAALGRELGEIEAAKKARASFRLVNEKVSDVAAIGRNAVGAYMRNASDEARAARELWWNWWLDALGKYGWRAGWILLTIVMLPIVFKSVAFWVIAPLAPRVSPVRLANDGEPMRGGKSRRVLSLNLDAENELYVRGGLQTSGEGLKETDRPVLFWRKWLLCMTAGLVRFERYRATCNDIVTITAYDDHHHVMAIEIPAGGAVTLHSRAMVGLLKRRTETVLPYRMWCANRLLSWMTFRFRYILFPGPCTLIVQGKGGVYVQSADDGRSIDGRLTLGFDKAVGHGIAPSLGFGAYWRGERGLFKDRFSGGGSYIYQAQQSFPPQGQFWARGLKGLWDVFLSVFGI